MRDLIEKVLKMGLNIAFSDELGFSVIRLYRSGHPEEAVASCSLGTGEFRTTVEETLQGMLMDLERRGV